MNSYHRKYTDRDGINLAILFVGGLIFGGITLLLAFSNTITLFLFGLLALFLNGIVLPWSDKRSAQISGACTFSIGGFFFGTIIAIVYLFITHQLL